MVYACRCADVIVLDESSLLSVSTNVNILDLFFPKRCVGCGKFGRYFCPSCRASIRIIEPNESICPMCERLAVDGVTHPRCQTRYALDGLTTFFRYSGPVRAAVKQLKYRLVSDLASEFIDFVPLSSLPSFLNPKSYTINLVPIPLHPSRFRHRGFNQVEVLAARLAKRLNIPMRTDILRRVKKTVPQVDMKDKGERMKNMKDVFAVSPSHFVSSSPRILLVDDVFTTGATMRSAANVLKRAGAKFVWGITMAR